MSIQESIVAIARSYKGNTELPQNSGFSDKVFQKKMEEAGWLKGQAWCSFFSELVWKEAYASDKEIVKELNKLFSGAATATFKNFSIAGWKTGTKPMPGAIAIWRYGNGWQGHAGIVTEVVDKTTFKCVEGNSNDKGGREGYIVWENPKRKTDRPYSAKGLNLIGFIYPK